MPPKIGIEFHGLTRLSRHAGFNSGPKAAGMKWVGGYPENSKRGLPYVTGLLVLNDPETGVPVALMDCTWITAQRTGAATAVAAKISGAVRVGPVGTLGCGVQGAQQSEALQSSFPLKKVLCVR